MVSLPAKNRAWILMGGVVVGVVCLLSLLAMPRRHSSTLELIVATDTGASSPVGLDMGVLGPLAGTFGLGGADGMIQLRRVQALARSERMFLQLLQSSGYLRGELQLGSSASREDTTAALAGYRRLISTRLDSQSQSLVIQLMGEDVDGIRETLRILGRLLTQRLNEIRQQRSLEKVEYLEAEHRRAQANLQAAEDSLVSVLEANVLNVNSPRAQQKIKSVERQVLLWSGVLQALSMETIRMAATATLEVPDIIAIAEPTVFDRKSGFGAGRALVLSVLAAVLFSLFLVVIQLSRDRPRG